ncbi:MAG: class II fumarate hydratase, partial [Gemmatimonadetes bacterium]|nr:class II fumarate hydratase [Gemmatimonadota bacterium]
MSTGKGFRIERDALGEVRVPAGALYGASTQRAVENFPVSGLRFPRRFLRALGAIKWAAARVNMELGLLDRRVGAAIEQAAQEVRDGLHDAQFVIDIFQTGSGTSTNMNANEVIANRAIQISGGKTGSKEIHPNDHVNLGQSSNDVIPSAAHVAALAAIREDLLPALERLRDALAAKAREFDDIVKTGRTHLMDATPIRLGQEFSGYASQIEHGIARLKAPEHHLAELAIGGTAVGTGINTHQEFGRRVSAELSRHFGIEFREAENHFEAQGARDAMVEASGALRTIAVSLLKIANDLRWLGSGPRCGLAEISLPAVQPGSSIMPGKVNPVIAEAVCQVSAQVIGNDAAITVGGSSSTFELNTMVPLMTYDLLQSIELLANVSRLFADRCVAGIEANDERLRMYAERSATVATALAPHIGYDRAAEAVKEALARDLSIRQVVLEKKWLREDELDRILELRRL